MVGFISFYFLGGFFEQHLWETPTLHTPLRAAAERAQRRLILIFSFPNSMAQRGNLPQLHRLE